MSDPVMQSFVDGFELIVLQNKNEIAMIDNNGNEYSYAELNKNIDRTLYYLNAEGLLKGDTLLALLPNATETILLFLACLKGGLRFAPLPCTATISEATVAFEMTHAKLVIIADPVTPQIGETLSDKVKVNWIDVSSNLNWLQESSSTKKVGGGQLIITTSGSTGTAKAILIDGDKLWSSGYEFSLFHGLNKSQPRFWNYLPMSYLGGLFNLALIPLSAAGSFVITEPFSGKTFLTFWANVKRYNIDTLWMVPTIVRGLLKLSKITQKQQYNHGIRKCFVGTAPITLQEKETFRDFFDIEMLENYALSETTFITSETPENIKYRCQGSVGEVLPYIKLKLATIEEADDEKAVQEILVNSPFLMRGYLTPNGNTDAINNSDQDFRTMDLGYFSDDQQLVITGRTRDIIKKGGYLILLSEIEDLVSEHPAISEVAAIPIHHSFYGESYELYLLTKENIDTSNIANSVHAWIQDRLSRHKWPDQIFIRDEFPRTASGKVIKSALSNQIS